MNCAVFFSGLLFLVTASEAYPEEVTTTIRNGNENIILILQLSRRYLANNNLPVWYAWKNRAPELMTDVMNSVGPFALYHDLDQSAAIVYTEMSQTFIGIIDTRFYVDNLPLSLARPDIIHDVNGPYVKLRNQGTTFHDSIHPPIFPYVSDQDLQYLNNFELEFLNPSLYLNPELIPSLNHHPTEVNSTVFSHAGSINHHGNNCIVRTPPPGDVLYAELLIFVSHHIVQAFNMPGSSTASLVIFYLIHFNAIDMLYAKLARYGIMIHINIAGLVLEAESTVFPYVFMPGQPQPYKMLDALSTLRKIPKYIKKYRNIFVEDSFDFFYLSTNYKLLGYNGAVLDGGAEIGFNVYDRRKNLGTAPNSHGLAVYRKSIIADFITGAHEIAHLMKLGHDSPTEGYIGSVQCKGIMQLIGYYCRYCIEWSSESVQEFRTFVSSHIDRCFLLNQPRSLYPYGYPITTIGPNRQCLCYGYESHWMVVGNYLVDEVTSNNCDKKLVCARNNKPVNHKNPRPIDGTPCGQNNVCWNRECRSSITV